MDWNDKKTIYATIRGYKLTKITPPKSFIELLLVQFKGLIDTLANIPDYEKETSAYERTIAAFTTQGIEKKELHSIRKQDRHTLAMEAVWIQCIRYFSSKESASFFRYVALYAPRSYALLIKQELPNKNWDLVGLPISSHTYYSYYDTLFDTDECLRIASPNEYVALITEKKTVKEIATHYKRITRTMFYKYLKRITEKTKQQKTYEKHTS
jgi:hypothetical protein